jgi:hypothetical protein
MLNNGSLYTEVEELRTSLGLPTIKDQATTMLPLLPGEIWLEIASQLGFERQHLRSLSLVCSTLRDTIQPLLFLSHTFVIGGYDYDKMESLLERLRFIACPRIAASVRQLRIQYEEASEECYYSIRTSPFAYGMSLLDRIVSSLYHFTSMKELIFVHVPIFYRHLQNLGHPSLFRTRLSFVRCTGMDLEDKEGSLAISSLHFAGRGLDADFRMSSLFKATLTPTLTRLCLFNFKNQGALDEVAASGVRLEMLSTLDIGEESFASVLKYAHMFPNVFNLTVHDGSGLESLSHLFPILKHNNCFQGVLHDTAFAGIETLECPIRLLPLFLGRPIRMLTLSGRRAATPRGRDNKILGEMLLKIDESQALLSQISALKLLNFLDLHRDVKDLLAPLIAHCSVLRRLEISHHDQAELASKTQLQVRHSKNYLDSDTKVADCSTFRPFLKISVKSLGRRVWKAYMLKSPIFGTKIGTIDL